MKNDKTNIGIIITITIFIMLMLFGVCLFVLSTMGYLNFDKTDVKDENINNNINKEDDTNNNIEEDNIDYTALVGKYVDSSNKSLNDVNNTGGVILNVQSISDKSIMFDIESISSNQRVATSTNQDIEITSIENNTYNFNWTNDGWNNLGNGSITIADGEILLSVNTTKISDDNLTGWSLGNFDNKTMYKVSE